MRPHLPPHSRTLRGQQWSEEGQGEPDSPGDGEEDSDTGDEWLDVPEPPDVAVAHGNITALLEEQGRLRQQKVWEPHPHQQRLKPHHQGAEFDESQPSSTGVPQQPRGGHGYSQTGVWGRGRGPWQEC